MLQVKKVIDTLSEWEIRHIQILASAFAKLDTLDLSGYNLCKGTLTLILTEMVYDIRDKNAVSFRKNLRYLLSGLYAFDWDELDGHYEMDENMKVKPSKTLHHVEIELNTIANNLDLVAEVAKQYENVQADPSEALQDVPVTFPVNTAYSASEEEFKKAFELILAIRKQKQLQKKK